MDVVAGLLLLGAGQGAFLAALLVLRPQLRTASNLFLATLVAALTLTSLDDVWQRSGGYDQVPWSAGLGLLLLPLFGPLLRFHLDALVTKGEWRLTRRHSGWLAGAAAGTFLAIGFLSAEPSLRSAIFRDEDVDQSLRNIAILCCLIGVYAISAVQQGRALLFGVRLSRAAHELDDSTASRLLWIRGLLVLALGCWLAYLTSLAAGLVNNELARQAQDVASLLYVASLYLLGLLGLARPDTLLPAPGDVVATILEPIYPKKYQKSALDEEDAKRLVSKIETLFNRDQPYLDATLSLPRLASMIGASTNDTSQAINRMSGENFYDLVSRWRIEEAKRRLADCNNSETVIEICFAVGFNSKSVFNSAFKRFAGDTPTAFRKRHCP